MHAKVTLISLRNAWAASILNDKWPVIFFISSFQEETFSYNEEIHLKIAEYKTKAANVYIFFYTVIVKCFIRIHM